MKEEKKEYNGQPYERPTLQQWGTVADLTAVGRGAGGDIYGGSVNEDGCATGGGQMAAGAAACEVSY